jgi:hypothetical protein
VNFFAFGNGRELLADAFGNFVGRHGEQSVDGTFFFGIAAKRADDFIAFDKPYGDVFHDQNTGCPAHFVLPIA